MSEWVPVLPSPTPPAVWGNAYVPSKSAINAYSAETNKFAFTGLNSVVGDILNAFGLPVTEIPSKQINFQAGRYFSFAYSFTCWLPQFAPVATGTIHLTATGKWTVRAWPWLKIEEMTAARMTALKAGTLTIPPEATSGTPYFEQTGELTFGCDAVAVQPPSSGMSFNDILGGTLSSTTQTTIWNHQPVTEEAITVDGSKFLRESDALTTGHFRMPITLSAWINLSIHFVDTPRIADVSGAWVWEFLPIYGDVDSGGMAIGVGGTKLGVGGLTLNSPLTGPSRVHGIVVDTRQQIANPVALNHGPTLNPWWGPTVEVPENLSNSTVITCAGAEPGEPKWRLQGETDVIRSNIWSFPTDVSASTSTSMVYPRWRLYTDANTAGRQVWGTSQINDVSTMDLLNYYVWAHSVRGIDKSHCSCAVQNAPLKLHFKRFFDDGSSDEIPVVEVANLDRYECFYIDCNKSNGELTISNNHPITTNRLTWKSDDLGATWTQITY